jgi:HEAT repeat protein
MPRTVLLIGALILACTGCHRTPPYEGKSVSQLEQMLRDSNPKVQAQGAFGLSRLGAAAQSATPALIDGLTKDPLVRQYSALALGQIGPEARDAVPALILALQDPEWAVRRQVALSLSDIGLDARAAIPALQKLTQDHDSLVRKAAQQALKTIQARAEKSIRSG